MQLTNQLPLTNLGSEISEPLEVVLPGALSVHCTVQTLSVYVPALVTNTEYCLYLEHGPQHCSATARARGGGTTGAASGVTVAASERHGKLQMALCHSCACHVASASVLMLDVQAATMHNILICSKLQLCTAYVPCMLICSKLQLCTTL